jgi:hypothetical protein
MPRSPEMQTAAPAVKHVEPEGVLPTCAQVTVDNQKSSDFCPIATLFATRIPKVSTYLYENFVSCRQSYRH